MDIVYFILYLHIPTQLGMCVNCVDSILLRQKQFDIILYIYWLKICWNV